MPRSPFANDVKQLHSMYVFLLLSYVTLNYLLSTYVGTTDRSTFYVPM